MKCITSNEYQHFCENSLFSLKYCLLKILDRTRTVEKEVQTMKKYMKENLICKIGLTDSAYQKQCGSQSKSSLEKHLSSYIMTVSLVRKKAIFFKTVKPSSLNAFKKPERLQNFQFSLTGTNWQIEWGYWTFVHGEDTKTSLCFTLTISPKNRIYRLEKPITFSIPWKKHKEEITGEKIWTEEEISRKRSRKYGNHLQLQNKAPKNNIDPN